MRYVGGKARQAKSILSVVNEMRDDRTHYVEPFVGGGSVLSVLAPTFNTVMAGDICPELVAMWKAVAQGWVPPATMAQQEYNRIRSSPSGSCPLRGWAAFAASYNGKWFGGYGPTAPAAGRDYLAESQRSTLRKANGMAIVEWVCGDYSTHEVDENTVVYCDPPYQGTMGYGGSGGIFDSRRFWFVMELWSLKGALVLVHEFSAPPGWTAIHEAQRVETMHLGPSTNTSRQIEKLYCYDPTVNETER